MSKRQANSIPEEESSPSYGGPRQRTRGNGDGGVYRLPDGRYRWQVTVGRDANGKQKRLTGIAENKTEANRRRTEVLAAYQQGKISLPSTTTLGDWLDLWLARRQPHIAVGTYEQYVFRLKHVPADLRRLQLQAIKRPHIRELDGKLTAKGLAASSRSKILSHLRAAFEAAIDEELLIVNPAQGVRVTSTLAERSRHKRKALDLKELDAFIKAAETDRLYVLFYTLFSLGLRRGEALGLRWTDVDLQTGEIRVEQQVKIEGNQAVIGSLKTTGSRRRLYASPDLLALLHIQHRRQQEDQFLVGPAWTATGLIFTTAVGTPIHPRNVNHSICLICDAAGLARFSSHSARHTHISQRLRNGEKLEVVSASAGHASSEITLNTYRHVFDDEKRTDVFSLREQLAPIQINKENNK
ncbi:site-specific integrase [Deinococcus sp. Arct2-2]|uniref:tyrosine-type recombinase/integrase n=1 Tax=Deinococcus sp. Arct2-2 TaxID=2568653 RepID=UPI0010A48A02|nr:tyrosine-type recombinase/integrase [Deinococcus sp. Arct2-2]THF70146.1 site-specific integrase [Deinococcus sp. Arct2-2]